MAKFFRLNIMAAVIVFLLTINLGYFTPVHAESRFSRPGRTQSELKEKGKTGKQKALIRWESLSPAQQEQMSEVAKKRAGQAKMTSEEYWNSLSAEEQQELIEGKDTVIKKGKQRWRDKPK
jgi:hypothetical protein